MFRQQTNAFDDVVIKATDENLTSENWGFMFEVVDKVGSAETGAKDAVAALIKRLAHRNANVQLYTLELANALSQNCGVKMHQELASRSFTEALLRLAADRNTHQQVKAKILERMEEWAEMFKSSPELGIMNDAYMRLKSQNPTLHAPSKPQKTQITESDKKREEEELQMALALSIKDSAKAAPPASSSQGQSSSSAQAEASSSSADQPAQPVGQTAATVSRVRALFDFTPSEAGELAFRKGDIIAVLESVYKDWWKGSLRGQEGIFPLNYVEKLQDPTKEELEREAQMEAEVFAEMKNVERLLALLSTNSESGRGDVRENEEITELYGSTLSIRPKLIELIGKYSQKKDDFTQLNEKFIKARRDYEALLEASMSHPPQPSYGRPGAPYGYNAPPPSHTPGYGAPPNAYPPAPSQQPNRYYSPGPDGQDNYPPQTGRQPFYFVPPGQQGSQPPGQQRPPPGGGYDQGLQAGPAGGAHPNAPYDAQPPHHPQQHPPPQATQTPGAALPSGRPPTLYGPQELATGSFDSPIDPSGQRHSYHQPSNPYAPSHPPQSPVAQHQQYAPPSAINSLPSQQGQQQQPSDPYAAPPSEGGPHSPVPTGRPGSAAGGAYPPSGQPPQQQQQQQYQAYNPAAAQSRFGGVPTAIPPVPPGGGLGTRDEGEGFYR